MSNTHATPANFDAYLAATVAKIRKQVPGASIKISTGNRKWGCIIENYEVSGFAVAPTPSEAILQAWGKATETKSIAEAMWTKQRINKERQWPVPVDGEPTEHLRDKDNSPKREEA